MLGCPASCLFTCCFIQDTWRVLGDMKAESEAMFVGRFEAKEAQAFARALALETPLH